MNQEDERKSAYSSTMITDRIASLHEKIEEYQREIERLERFV